MKRLALAALALAACAAPAASPAHAGTLCRPNELGALILASPNVNDIHPDWQPPDQIGTGWSMNLKSRKGPFLRGTLNTSHGNEIPGAVYALASQWTCE